MTHQGAKQNRQTNLRQTEDSDRHKRVATANNSREILEKCIASQSMQSMLSNQLLKYRVWLFLKNANCTDSDVKTCIKGLHRQFTRPLRSRKENDIIYTVKTVIYFWRSNILNVTFIRINISTIKFLTSTAQKVTFSVPLVNSRVNHWLYLMCFRGTTQNDNIIIHFDPCQKPLVGYIVVQSSFFH